MAERPTDPIDFADLARALLDRAETLVPQWLPGGRRNGAEWVCGDLAGGPGGSCSVNLVTGAWADFSGDDRGGDLISLYAAIHNLNQGQAARRLMGELGWQRPQPARGTGRSAKHFGADMPLDETRPEPPPADDGPAVDARAAGGHRRSVWRAIVPVPAHAPPADFRHWHYTEVAGSWEYRFEGQLYGHVVRFATSDGGKEILPHTWCVDEGDARGTQRWHWKQWDEPRPLYVPATLLSGTPRDVPVVLVEGEKCALAGHQLLGHEFDFVSWPGGSNAWAKAAWGWLLGRTVYLWPDADAKRAKLTPQERKDGVDPASKPLLPESRQPGMKAMVNIGSLLVAEQACTVLMCPVPAPDKVATDGWDIADAIAGGWTAEDVRAFIRGARSFVPPDDAARAKAAGGISTPTSAGAGRGEGAGDAGAVGDESRAWRDKLLTSANSGAIKAVRENVVLAIDGMALDADKGGGWLPGVPEAEGVIAFNEFTNDVVKLRDTPWGTAAGVWDEVDELEMGNWLTRVHWLPSMPRGTLEEAVAMVAKRHRFHPVRDRFNALRGTWDGEKRLGTWLRRCCLEEDEFDDGDRLQQYLARVGTWLVMAVCARVLTPGCKFDYMVIFEGAQGVGKSTLARLLGCEWFADTGLVLGDKDSYQNLQGVLVYEWGELDSLTKTEVTKVKQFISSMKDRFRASFDRRAKDYPRQVVFIGTTNEDHYLVDPTGNRRMLPVRVTRQIDLEWFAANRDQLFAEALVYLDAGDRFHPTTKEQRELFEPQQQQRQIENAIQAAILRYLYDEDQKVGVSGGNGTLVNDITAPDLLTRLGISVDKQTQALLRQATAAMRHAGWTRYRSSRGDRPWMFKRPDGGKQLPAPEGFSTRPTQADQPAGASDDCPF